MIGEPVEISLGICEINYQLKNSSKQFTKTVYDPGLYPKMPEMTVSAVNKALINYQITRESKQFVEINGIIFDVPVFTKAGSTPTVRTAYPTKLVTKGK